MAGGAGDAYYFLIKCISSKISFVERVFLIRKVLIWLVTVITLREAVSWKIKDVTKKILSMPFL